MAVLLGLLVNSWLRLNLPKDAVESSLAKITRVLPHKTWERIQGLSLVSVLTFDAGGPRAPTSTLLQLARAVADQHCVTLEYGAPEPTVRTVEPYGVAGFQGHWYLAAFCRLRSAMRLFRLDRIRSLAPSSARFERPQDFSMDRFFREGLASQRWKLRLWFDTTEDEIRRTFGTIGEIRESERGREYLGSTDDLAFTAKQLLFSGLSFRVIEPIELKHAFSRIADTARALAAEP